MSDSVDADKTAWAKLHEAAANLGIDISTLPTAASMRERQNAREPPQPIALKLRPLTKRQLAALHKGMPPASKWLTKIPVDEFLEAVRRLAAVDFHWHLMEVKYGSVPAYVARYIRCQKSGVFAALDRIVDGSPEKLFDSTERELFRALAADERRHHERVELCKQARLKKLRGKRVFLESRGH